MNISKLKRKQELDSILAQSRQMLVAAQEGDWKALTEWQSKRQERIRAFFSISPTKAEAEMVNTQIHEILSLNEQLVALANRKRQDLKDEVRGLAKGRKATKTYQQNI